MLFTLLGSRANASKDRAMSVTVRRVVACERERDDLGGEMDVRVQPEVRGVVVEVFDEVWEARMVGSGEWIAEDDQGMQNGMKRDVPEVGETCQLLRADQLGILVPSPPAPKSQLQLVDH